MTEILPKQSASVVTAQEENLLDDQALIVLKIGYYLYKSELCYFYGHCRDMGALYQMNRFSLTFEH